jgi:hypothetical protein
MKLRENLRPFASDGESPMNGRFLPDRVVRKGDHGCRLRGMKTRSRGQDRAAVIGFESGRSAASEQAA